VTTAISADVDQWSIGSLVLNSFDAAGGQWIVNPQATTGWYDGVGPRLNLQDAPRSHGAYRANSYNAERTIVVPGKYDGRSIPAAIAARDYVTGLYANGTQQLLTVAGNGISRSAMVEMGAQPKLSPFVASNFDFQLTLTAADPRKYGGASISTTGPAASTGGLDWITGGGLDWITGGGLNWGSTTSTGVVSATNPGTADSWPTFTIAANGGSIVNPVLTDYGGNVMSFALTLSGTDTLVISMNPLTRYAQYNGTDTMGRATSAQWWNVAAGATDTVSFGALSFSGSPSLSMSLAPAYW
jgi:hypothetical protein